MHSARAREDRKLPRVPEDDPAAAAGGARVTVWTASALFSRGLLCTRWSVCPRLRILTKSTLEHSVYRFMYVFLGFASPLYQYRPPFYL